MIGDESGPMRNAIASLRLWQIMLAIAALAVLFGVVGVVPTLGILIAAGPIVLPVARAGRERRLLVAAWVSSLYPLIVLAFLCATWFAAWLVLGHRPRMSLDDPTSLGPGVQALMVSTILLVVGIPFSILLWIPLLLADSADRVRRKERTALQAITRMIVWTFVLISTWAAV